MPQSLDTMTAVSQARAGVISTSLASHVRDTAHALMQGRTVSHDAAELLVLCMGPLLDELIAYRRRAAEAMEPDLPDGACGNVVRLLPRD